MYDEWTTATVICLCMYVCGSTLWGGEESRGWGMGDGGWGMEEEAEAIRPRGFRESSGRSDVFWGCVTEA